MFDPRVLLAILTVVGAVFAPSVTAASPTTTDPIETGLARLDGLPTGCSMEETEAIVDAFLDAFNRGDVEALDSLVPDETTFAGSVEPGKFIGYTVSTDGPGSPSIRGGPGNFATADPAELLRHFETRHAQEERLTLLELKVVGPPDDLRVAAGIVGVTYTLERSAADLPAATTMLGKGSVDCVTQQIRVWAMGDLPASLANPTPVVTPISDFGGLLWAIRERASMVLSTSAVIDIIRPLVPEADYVFLIRAEVDQSAEPLILLAAGYDLSGGDAAADARSIEWEGTVIDEVADGAVEVYAGEQIVVLSLDAAPAKRALLAEVIGSPLGRT